MQELTSAVQYILVAALLLIGKILLLIWFFIVGHRQNRD